MYSYTAATLAIRAKCSFSFHYLSLPNDQPFCCHHPCCHFSGSPRFLSGYLLGLPSPLPSKTLFNAGRWRLRIFYRSRESDMMGLLPEAEERFTGLVEPSWKKGRREIQIESNEGEHRSSRKKGKTGICSFARGDGLSSIRDSEVNEIGRRRAGGEFLVGFCNGKKGARYDEVDVAEEEVREVRKYVDDSRREKRFPSKRDVTLDSRKEESSKRNGNLMRLGVKNVEEKVDQRANLAQQVNFRESVSDRRSKKVTKLSFIRLEDELDDVKRTSVSSNVKKIEKGESSTSAARKNSDIGHLMTGRDQQKRSLEKESKVADFRYNVTQSTAHPQRDFEETSVRGRGEQAFLEQSSAQVSQDKRIQLDRYAVKQDESKRSTQRLNEVSLCHGSDLERTSPIDDKSVMGKHMFPNLVQDSSQLSRNKRSQMELELHLSVGNRSEEKADKLIMEGHSIQLRGGERKKIDMGAVEHDEAQRSTHMFREVSEAHSGSMEASSLSRENWGMEFKSCSVQSSVPATKDKGTQVEMHDAFYDQIEMSMFDTNNIVNAASSLNYPVSRVDPQEYGAPLASNQVSSIIEQNDQASKQAYLLYGARMESERDASEFNLTRSNNRRISNSHETYNSRIENEKNIYSTETSSLVLTREEEIQRSSLTGHSLQSESMEITSTGSLHGISSPQPTNSELKYDAGWIGYQKIQHDMIYSGRTFEKSSASHVGEFVGDIQKEVVALKESGKTPNVSAGFQIGKPGRRDVQATLRIDNQNETSSTVLTQKKEETQSSLLVGESSQYKTMKIASTGSLGDVSSSVKNYSEVDNHNSRDGPDAIRHITNSTIKPVKRLVKTSAFHADEFVDEIQQDIISLNESRKEPNISIRFQIEEVGGRESEGTAGMQVGELTESIGYGDGRQIEEGQRLLSPGSGVSGPSDEMCSVQILSSQETSNAEEPNENSPTSGAVVLTTLETDISRRSPKSLWSYVADIIRLSWILRGHSHSSTSKSHKRTSSNESLSSEAWFSGPEPEEDGAGDEIQNAKNAGLLKESGPVKESVILPLKESNKEDMLTEIEPNSSISSGFMTSGLSDRIASFTVDAEHTQDSRSSQGTLSSVAIVESQLASKFEAALPSVTDIEESRARDKMKVLKPSLSYPAAVMRVGFSSSRIQATGVETADMGEGNNSSLENFEQPLVSTVDSALPRITDIEEVDRPGSIPNLELDPFREKLPEVGESKEAGIKRRKFQRNKQVLSEQFDEWEEAFKRENEQKKLDEFFMREAILEAKKGADTWEVPVGAVLVQNGRIIARGCNMVEELRDSTAHAEMICIREASNFLRTWRLAETTLYVTLEPCPMCAGAILQARIDTVVWGAPNRLLGADGSWVRLFPGGDGGSSSTNPTSQMTGPVHPFHPKITIRRGVLETECGDVMQQFFKLRRKNDKKPESPPPPNLPISTRPTKFFSKLHNIFSLIFCL